MDYMMDPLIFIVIAVIIALLNLWIMWGVIRSAVRSALRAHETEQHKTKIKLIEYQHQLAEHARAKDATSAP